MATHKTKLAQELNITDRIIQKYKQRGYNLEQIKEKAKEINKNKEKLALKQEYKKKLIEIQRQEYNKEEYKAIKYNTKPLSIDTLYLSEKVFFIEDINEHNYFNNSLRAIQEITTKGKELAEEMELDFKTSYKFLRPLYKLERSLFNNYMRYSKRLLKNKYIGYTALKGYNYILTNEELFSESLA